MGTCACSEQYFFYNINYDDDSLNDLRTEVDRGRRRALAHREDLERAALEDALEKDREQMDGEENESDVDQRKIS